MDEEILVVPRARLLDKPLQGFSTAGVREFIGRIRAHAVFRPRRLMEQDPSMKQIIPYMIVRHRDRVFLVQRSTGGGEPRLHGLFSIGVGGHVNRHDVEGADDVLEAGLRRELHEELVVDGTWRVRPAGVLNDDTNPVGRVHFGLVYIVEVDTAAVAVRESDVLSGRLVPSAEILALRGRMETWSQLILDAADPSRL